MSPWNIEIKRRLQNFAAGTLAAFGIAALSAPWTFHQASSQSGLTDSGGSAAIPTVDARARIESRSYPSVFEAWNPAQRINLGAETPPQATVNNEQQLTMEAKHDLVFEPFRRFGLIPKQQYNGLATEFTDASVGRALDLRRRLLMLNHNLILLSEVRYYNAPINYLPADSSWWKRGPDGQPLQDQTRNQFFLLDYENPEVQAAIAAQCRALVLTGVVDGCLFDHWTDDAGRIALIQKVRDAAGDNAILMGNTNGRRPEGSALYLNGMYMEGFGARFFADWRTAAENLLWAQSHLRAPVITALEGWYPLNSFHDGGEISKIQSEGRNDFALMREVTTLSLTHSNGYVLYADPNPLPTPDHLHDWYPFWDKALGHPIDPPGTPGPSGSYRRNFEHGMAIFNPPSNRPIHITFPNERISRATGKRGFDYDVNAGDGDIFLLAR